MKPFYLNKNNIFAVPIIHYNMEMSAEIFKVFKELKPDCIAVELPETMQLQMQHAASRLPDISVVIAHDKTSSPIYYMSEPCDPIFEGLRSALENQIPCYCIDLDVDFYPDIQDLLPDPYSIQRIGLKKYYEMYQQIILAKGVSRNQIDIDREVYMAKRLKELSFSYEKILYIGGMFHVQEVLKLIENNSFPALKHAERDYIEVCTLTEKSCREVMAESGWISTRYEELRNDYLYEYGKQAISESPFFSPDRQKLIYQLYKMASEKYIENTGNTFPGYHFRNIMKFVRNYALIYNRLMPDLYQILSAAKGCVDHNYAYEVWDMGTEYYHRRNIDGLPELDLTIDEVWGKSKIIRFHVKQPGRKNQTFHNRRKDRSSIKFKPPGPFSICSYPPEDIIVERFGNFLKKKGTQILTEDASKTVPFTSSLEDGIDVRETIRHWYEKKLFIKVKGKPPGGVGSVVMIFDEDNFEEENIKKEKYSWKTTWLGEHQQESDMAFYATNITDKVVGPGISRCEYGGFMMSYPPRRMFDVWTDPDYFECRSKAEILLMAAIDYSTKPLIVYVSSKPPRSFIKSFAQRYGKKIVYIPIGQISPVLLNKIRIFHVLDGHDRREIADEYIF